MNAAVHSADSPDVVLTRADPAGWQRLRDVRLAALSESPEMFSSSVARERAFDAAEWCRRASRPVTFIASRVGVDVGIAGVYEFDDGWSIAGMWIAPAARGTGVFDALIRACESAAKGAGATAVTLGVMEDNARGGAAYLRLGYEFTGEREHMPDGRDELFMAKTLTMSPPSN